MTVLLLLLLSFIMGLQNAVSSKTSRGSIRTTHMIVNITDLGMELGKLAYLRLRRRGPPSQVQCDPERVARVSGLIAMFVLGGLMGALGFHHIGFICVVPLASLLLALSMPPVARDWQRAAFSYSKRKAEPPTNQR